MAETGSLLLAIDKGVVYVADRENGRVQLFDLDGNVLDMWTDYGKTLALQVEGEAIWLATQQRMDPPGPGAAGWLMKVDRATGTLLGYVNAAGIHGMSVSEDGDLLFSPAPNNTPRWLSPRGNR